MNEYRISLKKITNFETIWHTGWLISDLKNAKIILEADSIEYSPFQLKVLYILLIEGILNSSTVLKPEQRIELNYQEINIPDINFLSYKLTEETGIQFSLDFIENK
jgi:hypothetical protein